MLLLAKYTQTNTKCIQKKKKKGATVPEKTDCVAMATVSTAEADRVVIRPIRLQANYGMYLKLC